MSMENVNEIEKKKSTSSCFAIGCGALLVLFLVLILLSNSGKSPNPIPVEPTKASESSLNENMRELAINDELSSGGLNKADLAKYAQDTYGWDCDEVISVDKKLNPDDEYIEDSDIDFYGSGKVKGHKKYDVVICSSGLKGTSKNVFCHQFLKIHFAQTSFLTRFV